jgi:hypothetical protein
MLRVFRNATFGAPGSPVRVIHAIVPHFPHVQCSPNRVANCDRKKYRARTEIPSEIRYSLNFDESELRAKRRAGVDAIFRISARRPLARVINVGPDIHGFPATKRLYGIDTGPDQ